jgi:uncharacterized protein
MWPCGMPAPSPFSPRPPDRPWFLRQTWQRLLFAHWRVPVAELRAVVPEVLPLDEFDGSAWITVTPFRVSGFRLRLSPSLPWLSSFLELNVRTYVTVGGRPGIWFLSLDAARWLAVVGARRTYRLPYFHARMSFDGQRFTSSRTSRDGEPAEFEAAYHPVGPAARAAPGSLEEFLIERYCLYALDERQRILRGEIAHPPWLLQPAEADIALNTMTRPFRFELEGLPMLHFAEGQDVIFWRLRPA